MRMDVTVGGLLYAVVTGDVLRVDACNAGLLKILRE